MVIFAGQLNLFDYTSPIGMIFYILGGNGAPFSLAIIKKITNSVFICILFHSCVNAFASILILRQDISTVITALIKILISLIIFWFLKKSSIDTQGEVRV